MQIIENKDDFLELVKSLQSSSDYRCPLAFGIACLDLNSEQKTLAASFAQVNYKENLGCAAVLLNIFKDRLSEENEQVIKIEEKDLDQALMAFAPFLEEKNHKNVEVIKAAKKHFEKNKFAFVVLFEDEKTKSLEAVYLKLYLLSLNKVELRSLDLQGAFALLPNLAWSDNKPYELEYLKENEAELKFSKNYPKIDFVDKFPRFLAHIIPDENTRILDDAKVRMGAKLGAGTTVMPGASYINFNAGTTGSCMVEGRISSSAIVGEGSDIGGGASILGVLSGTSGTPISVGRSCLLGANCVVGISLGDNCTVDAGIAVLEGSKVHVYEAKLLSELNPDFAFVKKLFKAGELSSLKGLHFRIDSCSGELGVYPNKKIIELNPALHS